MRKRTKRYIDRAIEDLSSRLKAIELDKIKDAGFEVDCKFHTVTFPKGDPKLLLEKLEELWPTSVKPIVSYYKEYSWAPASFSLPHVNWKLLQGGQTLNWFKLTAIKKEKKDE